MNRKDGRDRGAALAEYAVLTGLISVMAIVSIVRLGGEVRDGFTDVAQANADARNSALGGPTATVPSGEAPVIGLGQDFSFDTYLDPGTVVHTVTTSGPPAASFTLTGVDGLMIDNAGVISVTDVAAFGPFGTSVVATVTAATAEGASSSELINITRLTATDPNIEWQVMQTYDVFWEHGDSGWPEQFAATGPVAAEVHQVCIDEAQRLNDEPQDLPFPWSEPEIVVYGYYTFTTGTGNAACNGTKLQTFTQYDWFYNTTSSTDELWWQAEAPLRTGTYNGGDIQNAQYSGMPYIY